MNEVSLVPKTTHVVASTASSKGTEEAILKSDGNVLPDEVLTQETKEAPKAQEASKETLQTEVANVNKYVHSVQRDLHFSVDEDLDRTVIRVVDRDSGELIRQIPDDIFLELARRLKEDGEMNILNALG